MHDNVLIVEYADQKLHCSALISDRFKGCCMFQMNSYLFQRSRFEQDITSKTLFLSTMSLSAMFLS
jgi:hypothetical protein